MRIWWRYLLLAALIVFPNPSIGNDLLLEWTSDLKPGAAQSDVEHYLRNRGIKPVITKGGFTYSSKIWTPQRNYLFCNEQLSNIIEGEHVDGARFNYWMSAFLATQKKLGDPANVEYEEFWRQIKFRWELEGDSSLYFLIRGAPPDAIIWSRELLHEPSSRPCYESSEQIRSE